MQIIFYDAQQDSGSFCPHIIIIRDSNNNLLYEYYAKPNDNGQITSIDVPDNAIYNIELINPNLFESKVIRNYLFWNSTTNSTDPVSNQVEVNSGQRNILTIDSSTINNNILLETTNYGTNVNNIINSIVGSIPIRGIDLDGNSLAGNEEIFSKLNFKNIINNQLSTFTIDNKRLRRSSPDGAFLDSSVYVPYLPSYNVNISLITPIITIFNDDTLEWTNPQTPKESNKRYNIYKDNVLFATRDSTTLISSNSIFIENLVIGSFKINYSLDNTNFSDFSNVITLNPNTSTVPIITGHTDLDINGNGTISINAQPNACIYKSLNGGNYELEIIKTDSNNGNLVVTVNTAGTYTFKSKTDGSIISNYSNQVIILSNQSSCVGITNLLINVKPEGETPNSTRTIGYTYDGSLPISRSWQINGQGASIISGINTDYPEFRFGNSNGFITLSVVDCTGTTFERVYNFTLNTLVTPYIAKVNETTVNWNNDSNPSLKIKTVRVYDQSDGLVNEISNTSGSDNIYVGGGNYKIKYSTNGIDFSGFSNLVTTNPLKTTTPTVSINPNNGQINTDGTQSVLFTVTNYIPNSTVKVCRNDVMIDTITQSTYNTNVVGNYCFTMIEYGKIESLRTANIPISYIPSNISCNNGTNVFSIFSSIYDYTNNKLTFVFNASSLTSATWKIKLGTQIIDSGVITSFDSNTKVITTSVNLQNNNYIFELTGVSCNGVATSNLIVSNVPSNSCVFSNTSLVQDSLIVNLINFRFDCNIKLDSISYDILNTNDNIIFGNQIASTPVLLSGNTYTSQLDFLDVTEGSYKINLRYGKNGISCNVVIPFIFVLQDSDITTGELTGIEEGLCDFTNLVLSQIGNTNFVVGNFNSSMVLTNIVYDLISSNGTIVSNLPATILNYNNGIYAIKLDFNNVITGTYSIKIKSNNCDIINVVSFVKNNTLPDTGTVTATPVINFNYNTSKFEFLPSCSDGIVKVYVNNQLYYEPITRTSFGLLYTSLMLLNANDQLKITVQCPNKTVSLYSNTIILIGDSCIPVLKNISTIIHGDTIVTVNSQSNYSLVLDEIGGSLPFTYETTVVGGTIISGLDTSNIIVKFGNSQQAIINYKILNCNNSHFIELTKLITINPEVIIIVPNTKPKIVSIINNVLTGISTPNSYVNLYNENNDLIYANIKTNSNGTFTAIVKKYKAYYTRIIVGSGLSEIGNIFVNGNGVINNCATKCNII